MQELGLTSRGAGADNIRNITATPTSGFDPDELIDVRPYAHGLHHYILNHRELYGLAAQVQHRVRQRVAPSRPPPTPTTSGSSPCASDREIARSAPPSALPLSSPASIFAASSAASPDTRTSPAIPASCSSPRELVPVAAAMVRVFRENGDRTDRKKARLKYLLEKWGGFPQFLEETQKKLAFPLVYAPRGCAEPRRPVIKHGHLGVYKQTQPGMNYVGVGVPVGRHDASRCAASPTSPTTTARASCASRSGRA